MKSKQDRMVEAIKMVIPDECSTKTEKQIRSHASRLIELDRLTTQCKTYFVYVVLSLVVNIIALLYSVKIPESKPTTVCLGLSCFVIWVSVFFTYYNTKDMKKLRAVAREDGWE